MNSIEQIISEALAQEVVLYLKEGRLAYVTPSGGFPSELKVKVIEHKEAITAYLQQLERTREAQELRLPEISPRTGNADLPLSFAQQRLWFIDKFEGGSTQFNMVNVFRLEGELNLDVFERALKGIVDRHESIRTVFEEWEGETRQVVSTGVRIPLACIDLSNLPPEQQEQQVTALIAKDANTSFDLSRDVLLRVALLARSRTDHVAVFNLHHIASDGWSLALLVEEFSALYTAYSQGRENPLIPLKVQYADYALWQRSWLQGETLDRQVQYWDRRLDSIPMAHSLPLDHPRPSQQSFRGKFHVQSIDADLAGPLKAVAQQHDVTMFILLQSAFALLVARYGNAQDVVMGTPVAGRPHKDTESLIGFFINSVVLRTSLGGNPTFTDYLKSNRESILGDYAHQHVPFEMLVERLRPERNLSHSPLFQIVFGLNNNESRQLELAGLKVSMLPNEVNTAKVDLELSITELEGAYRVLWSFSSDLFEHHTIEAMAAAFDVLLRAIVRNPAANILALPLLEDGQQAALYALGAGESTAVPAQSFVHGAFESSVLATPSATAVICNGTRLTFDELNQKANRLAHYLRDIGLRRGARVGVYLKRSIEQLIGVLGIMKAGASYVPLEPSHPKDRVDFIIGDASVELVLTAQSLVQGLALGGFDILDMDDAAIAAEWLDEYPADNLSEEEGADPAESLVYVLYTSGSTGKPKGVMLTHRGAHNYLQYAAGTYLQEDMAGAIVSSPLCFDATLTTFLAPLFVGKPVVLLPDDENTLQALDDHLSSGKRWLFKITPAHLDAIGQTWSANSAEHVIVIGGEQLTSATLLRWKQELLPKATFINEYGPTETVVGCSTFAVTPEVSADTIAARSAVPIGKAIHSTQLCVLNEALQLQPLNCAGELYIGGLGVATGYVNLPNETSTKFVRNPFSSAANDRLYKTGDLVRWLPDGNLEFIGRADDQVKIRGYRIELGEIESQLRSIEGVREAAVVVASDTAGGSEKQLVGYVVVDASCFDRGEADSGEIGLACKSQLQNVLPEYMVPSAFVVLDEMPLTANGKIDRKQLPAADFAPQIRETYSSPTTRTEERLCQMWQELLKLNRVGITDNFFDLGGHSLLALRLIGRMRDEFSIELPLRSLFSNPTVSQLAALLAADSAGVVLPPIVRSGDEADAPLSFAQQRLWFIDRMQGGSIHYNMPGVFKLSGRLDETAFAGALAEIFRRHEVLRAEFFEQEDGVRQRIRNNVELPLRTLNLSSFPLGEVDEEVRRQCLVDMGTPFDLTRDLLLRVTLLCKSDDEHVVLFNMHHIVSDGWSMGVLVKEFCELYAAAIEGRAPNLTELPVQYSDYARWQAKHYTNEVLEQGLEYWRQRLSGIPSAHNLALDRPRPTRATYHGAAHVQQIPAELAQAARALARGSDVTLSMLLQTAFAVLLGRWSSEEDIVFGSTVAGRGRREVEPLIGFFVNSLVFRADISGDPRFSELLANTKQQILDDFNNDFVPFELIVEALNPERSMSYSPIFQVAFSLHNNENVRIDLPDLVISPMEQDIATAHFELVLNVNEVGDALVLSWVYNSDIFVPQKIARIADSFQTLLSHLVADADARIQSLPLVPVDDMPGLGLLGERVDLPEAVCFHELFAEQATQWPQRDAVVLGDRRLSYAELDEKSSRLANYLSDIGVATSARVGIYLERSIEMMIAILGIAKAGAAYVPLDPDYPVERIQYIVDDAGAELVLLGAAQMDALAIEGIDVLLMDDAAGDADWLAEFSGGQGLPKVLPTDLAYVLYTSGSTGKPKGVMVTHGGLLNYLDYAAHHYLGGVEASVVSSPLCFDATVTGLLAPLCVGKAVILLADDDDVLASLSRNLFLARAPRLFKITPAHLEVLAHMAEASTSMVPHFLVIGGEQLTLQNLMRWRELLPFATYVNEYGPTETVVGCCTYFVRPGESVEGLANQVAVPIGRPISNTQLYVMNGQRLPQPEGCTGELYIGGAGVARGYVNLAEMTAERFVCNPLASDKTDLLYRTGDLVRMLPEGQLEFVGRADSQVKIRGFRIEMAEIEGEIRGFEPVQDAIVVLDKSDPEDKQLVAYATLDERSTPAAARTLALLAQGQMSPDSLYRIGNGMELYGLNKAETEYLYDEIFVHKVYDRHGIAVRNGDCIFDVGANIGAFSVFLATRFDDLKVYSYEPILPVYRRLEVNGQIFGLNKIVPHCLGLSDSEKDAEFSFYPNVSLYSGLNKGKAENIDIVRTFLANKAEGGSEEFAVSSEQLEVLAEDRMKTERVNVRLSTISKQIRKYGIQSIDLLKIDVERSELDVLHGIQPEDWAKIKQVVVEVHNVDGAIEHVTSMLVSNGFDVVLDQDSDLEGTELFNLYARRPQPVAVLPELNVAKWRGLADIQRDLRKRLENSLPEYMVPAAIVMLDTIPLTHNGKIDCRKLPTARGTDLAKAHYVAPRNSLEEHLCQIWASVLKAERIGIRDNFFALGGHSLLALRLISQVRHVLGAELTIRELFERPTVAELAAGLSTAAAGAVLTSIGRADRAERLVVSHAQQRLWFLDRFSGGSLQYNMPGAFIVEGELDIDLVREALAEVIRRHEILRTTYTELDGGVFQVVHDTFMVPLKIFDLTGMPKESQDAELGKLMQEELGTAFDLDCDLMLRVSIAALGDKSHKIIFNMHHIASDGWSMGVLLREFCAAYVSLRDNVPPVLPPLDVQYADYASWHRGWLDGRVLQEQLSYWKTALKGLPQHHNLPIEGSRPAEQTFAGRTIMRTIGSGATQRVRRQCQTTDVTLFMYLETVFALLLSRFSGEADIAIGTPIAGRVHRDTESLIGCFLNTLVLRTDVHPDATFAELVLANREVILGAFSNQHVPFETLVDALNPSRNRSHSPLFQVMFTLQNNELAAFNIDGLQISPATAHQNMIKFDLELSCSEIDDGLVLAWSYNTDIFSGAFVDQLADCFESLIEHVLADPTVQCEQVRLLSEAGMGQVLGISRGPESLDAGAGSTSSIHRMFERQVGRTPNAVAVHFKGRSLNYREVNQRANRLARRLRACGYGDSIVGVSLPRSEQLLPVLLGALKAGAAYLPLDPSYPKGRVEHMLNDAGAAIIITTREVRDALALPAEQCWCIDSEAWNEELDGYPSVDLPDSGGEGAYVIYTSGSTGKPKGVQVSHSSVVNFLQAMRQEPGMVETDRLLAVTPISFDIHVLELFLPLVSGATVVVADRDACIDGEALVALLADEAITVMQATPATWKMMLGTGSWNGQTGIKILCGGESLDRGLADELAARATSLWNMYGPTEATVWTSCGRVEQGSGPITIGRPLLGTQIFVLDHNLRPQPPGVYGELCIGGLGLATGYWNLPELTQSSFINVEGLSSNTVRLYRSGDLGRWRADGRLECAGRLDRQAKVRGYRVEVQEIECQLSRLDAVRDSAVVDWQARGGEKQLVAYVVIDEALLAAQANAGTQQELSSMLAGKLRAELPEYMVPAYFEYLGALPLTANGKIDRKALPAPSLQRTVAEAYVGPRSDIEVRICLMWQELLGLERVGVNDDFFQLGGHSLLTTRVLSALRSEFGEDASSLSIREFFDEPTVAALANRVESSSYAARMRRRGDLLNSLEEIEEGEI